MTENDFVKAIQARFATQEAGFEDRIKDAIPVGVARVFAAFQWQFLDKYTTFPTRTTSNEASGKTTLTLPPDFAKIVVLYTDNHEIVYRDRVTWAKMQRDAVTSAEPRYYTIIGNELVLSAPSDGSTIYGVYTRKGEDIGIEDLPIHLAHAAMMAVVTYLAPAYIRVGDSLMPNPDVRATDRAFEGAVREAMKIESRQKGWARQLLPPEHLRMRNDYT